MSKQRAIPLKDVMAALDKRQRNFYQTLTAEQQKTFSAWMMMRYASSVQGRNSAHYLYMVNELVNKNFSDVSKHPELQWLLLSACGGGKIEFHPYIKPPNARKIKNKVTEFLSELYPHMKSQDLQLLIDLNTKQELVQIAEAHGYDDKTIREIFGK